MSAPPDPPDPRERLPKDGSPAVFEASGTVLIAVGLLYVTVAAVGLVVVALDPGRPLLSLVVLAPFLAVGLGYWNSARLVRRIVVDEGLSFHPAGLHLPVGALARMTWMHVNHYHEVGRLGLATREFGLRWLPGRLLWIGRRLTLGLAGTDGAAIAVALAAAMEVRTKGPAR